MRGFATMALSALARWTIAPELLLYVSALDSKKGSYDFQWIVWEKNERKRRYLVSTGADVVCLLRPHQ